MAKLHAKVGKNIGKVLLEIAQEAILAGEFDRAFETYTLSFMGMTKEHAMALLKNKYVLVADDDGVTVNMTDDAESIEANKENITDWDAWDVRKLDEIKETCAALRHFKRELNLKHRIDITDCSFLALAKEHFGSYASEISIFNIAAKLIAGGGFSGQYSNGEELWEELCENVENDCAEKFEIVLYYIVKYVENIHILHKEYMHFAKIYDFLSENEFISKIPPFINNTIENALELLREFSYTNSGYYHPMCNEKLYQYKESLEDDILSTKLGGEYCRYHILEKDIMDGYDAGWLSPDGKFYGGNGEKSAFIHLNIAEQLGKDDVELEKEGWIKIHGNEVYGGFGAYDGVYCPTDIQVKMVCDYIDKFHNHILYPFAKEVGGETEPLKTYDVRQMDRPMLHKAFYFAQ